MNVNGYRRIVLSMAGAVEGEHMGHPDFRVRGRIFATIRPDEDRGVVMLTPEQQAEFVGEHPEAFRPVHGGWGARGATQVRFETVRAAVLRRAVTAAWLNKSPESTPQGRRVSKLDALAAARGKPRKPAKTRKKAARKAPRRSR